MIVQIAALEFVLNILQGIWYRCSALIWRTIWRSIKSFVSDVTEGIRIIISAFVADQLTIISGFGTAISWIWDKHLGRHPRHCGAP